MNRSTRTPVRTSLRPGLVRLAVSATHSRDGAGRQLAALRRSLAPFQDVRTAEAAGFIPVSGCEVSDEGGMGVHYLHPHRAAQAPDAAKPSILLHEPTDDGSMPGHNPMMPVHYDLHVWLFDSNPAGVFAPWNPSVDC